MSTHSTQETSPVQQQDKEEKDGEDISTAPTHEEIERRAYELWQARARHGIEGTADQDWLAAEQELSKGSA